MSIVKSHKPLILSILFIFFSNFANSQKELISENYFGFTGGLGYYHLNLNIQKKSKFIQGISAGIVYKNYTENFKDKFLMGSVFELKYTQKGGENFFPVEVQINDTTTGTAFVPYDLKLNYVTFSYQATASIGKGKTRLNLYAGPEIGYLLSESLKFTTVEITEGYKKNIDFKPSFGLNFGAGIERAIGKSTLNLDFIYSHGLSNIYKSKSVNTALFYRNQVFMLNLSYLLNLKKKKDVEN